MRIFALAVVVAVALVGCGTIEEHQLARDGSEAAPAMAGTVNDFTASEPGAATTPYASRLAAEVDSCSGSCSATSCSCYGTYDCCKAGCEKCWSDHFPVVQ